MRRVHWRLMLVIGFYLCGINRAADFTNLLPLATVTSGSLNVTATIIAKLSSTTQLTTTEAPVSTSSTDAAATTTSAIQFDLARSINLPSSSRKPDLVEGQLGCSRYDSFDLYRLLERVGARNQRFMADTPEEAGRNFVALDPQDAQVDDTAFGDDPVGFGHSSTAVIAADVVESAGCNARCRLVRRRLNDALLQSSVRAAVADAPPTGDAGSMSNWLYREGVLSPSDDSRSTDRRQPAGCYLDRFIALGNCSRRGHVPGGGYERLCSACQGVFMLSRQCFPRFFNAVQCNRDDSRCIYDWWTNMAHGKCQARTLSFTLLRNVGTEDCQHWVYEHLQVPISCECYLSKTSWLKA